jgi:hypothetical protein
LLALLLLPPSSHSHSFFPFFSSSLPHLTLF